VRTGALLTFFSSEGGGAFREIRSLEIGTEDVHLVKMYCTSDNKPLLLDMRFTDFDIYADSIQGQPAAPPAPPPQRRSWVLTAGLLLGLLLLLALVGIWARRMLRPRSPLPASEAAPPLSFSCEACGKSLKARPELAGKKVKCPGCGRTVPVPAFVNSGPHGPSPSNSPPAAPGTSAPEGQSTTK
jgi:hypothetical protein